MKTLILWSALCVAFLYPSTLSAQDQSPVKFGKVSPADFNLTSVSLDSNANAVIVSDVGTSFFEGNAKGWFTLVFKRQQRIKIINQNGLDAANIQIPYYVSTKSNDEESVGSLQGVTYNLENGKVVETKLDSKQVFSDKLTKNWFVKKFTLPAVKAGSIIEVSYIIRSDFLQNLREWEFQGEYPRLWSEYQVDIPEFFRYVMLSQGSSDFHVKSNRSYFADYNVTVSNGAAASDRVQVSGSVSSNRWVMKDMPALRREPFTTTLKNHIAKVEFQLSQVQFPNSPAREVMGSWMTVNKDMMENEQFGAQLNKSNNWLDDDIKILTVGAQSQLEKAAKIYAYLRNQFTCTGRGFLYLSDGLKNVFKNKKGTEADINLLLIAMLKHEHIDASPVLLSTRQNGLTHEVYPLMDRFNYVVAQVKIGEDVFYLDASDPLLGFGKLPLDCYNGHARVLGDQQYPIFFESDSLLERKMTSVFITFNEKGEADCAAKTNYGYYESMHLRESVKEKGVEGYFKQVKQDVGMDIVMSNTGIDSLSNLDLPVEVHFDFKLDGFDEDIIYINPMLIEMVRENPFKSMKRSLPVEMPYAFDDIYILNLELPNGYQVDEIPKSTRVLFNEDEGYFEYMISHSDGVIGLRSRIHMKRANYTAEEYESLRDFYSYIIKKHAEQIVLKKKKA